MKPKSLLERKPGDALEIAAQDLLVALRDNYLHVDSSDLLKVLKEAYSAGVCVGMMKSDRERAPIPGIRKCDAS